MIKKNIMGSEVEEGFKCKPKELDPNKPIMYYKHLIYVCVDERCKSVSKGNSVAFLRDLVKELGLHKGKERIKVSRSLCQGACRYRQIVQINENSKEPVNNSFWLKHTHSFSKEMWVKILLDLKNGVKLNQNLIDMKIFE